MDDDVILISRGDEFTLLLPSEPRDFYGKQCQLLFNT